MRPAFALTHAAILAILATPPLAAQDAADAKIEPDYVIAVVKDRDSPYFDAMIAGFRKELDGLAGSEYRFEIRDAFNAGGQADQVGATLDRALADSDVDAIFAAGFVVTSIAAGLPSDRRRVPIVGGAIEFADLEGGSLIAPSGSSSVANYTFIQSPRRIPADLEKLAELAGTRKIYAIVDAFAFSSLEEKLTPRVAEMQKRLDIELEIVAAADTLDETLSRLPAEARAVYVAILGDKTAEDRTQLFRALAERDVLSFSMFGAPDVERGALAGLASGNTFAIHRRIALNFHQLLAGVSAEVLPVSLRADDRLVINMRVAREIGWSPDYDTSLAARFIEADVVRSDARKLDLEGAMQIASTVNPEVVASRAAWRAQVHGVQAIRSSYLPQLGLRAQAGAAGATEQIAQLVATPHHAESFSLGAEVRQLLFSDRINSQFRARRIDADAARLESESSELDAIEAAGIAYLDVLATEALYAIEQENLQIIENNLQLAKLRFEIGAADRSEVFRWQASQAQARAQLFQRDRDRRNARVALNVVLAAPRTRSWALRDIALGDREFYFMDAELSPIITTHEIFQRFVLFLRQEALERSPEIRAFEEGLRAQGILLRERRRRSFVPEINATAAFDRVLQDAHGVRGDSQNEWSVGIGFVVPLFEGGRRIAETDQIRAQSEQLAAQRDQALFVVEQRALAASYAMAASHPTMRLSRVARDAAEQNFRAVQAKYQQGAASVIDLLDAQSQLLTQRQSAAVAAYQYLRDVISMQRAIAWFEFQKAPEERAAWTDSLRRFLANISAEGDSR